MSDKKTTILYSKFSTAVPDAYQKALFIQENNNKYGIVGCPFIQENNNKYGIVGCSFIQENNNKYGIVGCPKNSNYAKVPEDDLERFEEAVQSNNPRKIDCNKQRTKDLADLLVNTVSILKERSAVPSKMVDNVLLSSGVLNSS